MFMIEFDNVYIINLWCLTNSASLHSYFRGIEIVRGKGISVRNLLRYSDNCTQQFKSQKVNQDLLTIRETIPDLETVRYSYFEPNEGKAQSDTLGALAKGAADRETLRTLSGVGDESADQKGAITEEIARRIRAGLNFKEDGSVGGYAFFEWVKPINDEKKLKKPLKRVWQMDGPINQKGLFESCSMQLKMFMI